MTESWKSVGNYYCDYCKAFIRNDAFNKRNHESSDRHQNALKRQVRNLHKKHEVEKRDLARTNRELLKMGGKLAPPVKGLEEAAIQKTAQLPKKVNVGVKQRKEHVGILEDAEVYRQALAAQAMPGQWTTTASETADGLVEDVKAEVKAEDEAKQADNHPVRDAGLSETAQALKRSREGHDDELLGYRVAVMEPTSKSETTTGPAVAFKKKKTKEKPAKPR